jgi:hypothetical protein
LSALDLKPLIAALGTNQTQAGDWLLQSPQPRIIRATHPEGPSLAIKHYPDPALAEREFKILGVLRDFGVNLAPEALALHGNSLLMTWLEGQALTAPPSPDDETMWHRLMACIGASHEISLRAYSQQIPMRGWGLMNPEDLMRAIELEVSAHPEGLERESLIKMLGQAADKFVPRWEKPAPVALCRRNYALEDFIWDGHHLLTVDWGAADWGDMAAEIGWWSAYPDYESLPGSHWAWLRWEFARLTADQGLIPRSTVYGHLAQLWWAARLSRHPSDLQARYWQRAAKLFGG